jgi:uncharacterized membrane protein
VSWFTFFLLLHIFTAIAAFGPNYAFPLIASFAQKDPRNAHLVTEIMHAIETRITLPAGVAMPFFGLALIYLGHIDLWGTPWLVISIAIYIVAYLFSFFVQRTNSSRMLRLLEGLPSPPAGPVPEATSGATPVAGGSGPPPEIAVMAKKLQLGGMFLTLLLTAIIVLMVWKPGA